MRGALLCACVVATQAFVTPRGFRLDLRSGTHAASTCVGGVARHQGTRCAEYEQGRQQCILGLQMAGAGAAERESALGELPSGPDPFGAVQVRLGG